MRQTLLTTTLLFFVFINGVSQVVALKSNLLYGAFAFAPNVGVEVGVHPHVTVELSAGYNPWNLKGNYDNNQKTVHWLVMAEAKYFLKRRFFGHYFGLHLTGGQYNIAQMNMPLLFGAQSADYRFEGYAAGTGVSYGYQLPLHKHWNIDFSIGVGYAYMNYDKYQCFKCGDQVLPNVVGHYVGPTKAAISIIYIIQ